MVLAALTVHFRMSDGSHKEEEIDRRRKRGRAGRASKNNIEDDIEVRHEIWRLEKRHKRLAHQIGGHDRDTVKQTNRQIDKAQRENIELSE